MQQVRSYSRVVPLLERLAAQMQQGCWSLNRQSLLQTVGFCSPQSRETKSSEAIPAAMHNISDVSTKLELVPSFLTLYEAASAASAVHAASGALLRHSGGLHDMSPRFACKHCVHANHPQHLLSRCCKPHLGPRRHPRGPKNHKTHVCGTVVGCA